MAIRILLWKSMCVYKGQNVFTPDQGLSLILGPIQDGSLALHDMHVYILFFVIETCTRLEEP
jgi:hypothetical protein